MISDFASKSFESLDGRYRIIGSHINNNHYNKPTTNSFTTLTTSVSPNLGVQVRALDKETSIFPKMFINGTKMEPYSGSKNSAISSENFFKVNKSFNNNNNGEIKDNVQPSVVNMDVVDVVNTIDKPLNSTNGIIPDHHARRPMNAFLIFCKRHRPIVRNKYPTYENRAITKILGDWWANLSGDEKICFTKLAKEYKDAFFDAYPNFQWYKLPAPPRRTLAAIPIKKASQSYDNNEYEDENEDDEEIDRPKKSKPNNNRESDSKLIGSFKFADINQMGSLNSLISASQNNNTLTCDNKNNQHNVFTNKATTMLPPATPAPKLPSQTSSCTEPFDKSHFNKHGSKVNVNIVSASVSMDNVSSVPTSRSCKGKRYQEFITSGMINPVTKKVRSLPMLASPGGITTAPLPTATTLTFPHNAYCKQPIDDTESVQLLASIKAEAANEAANGVKRKQFDASDFNLENKILALPALNLELYLSRKRGVKKRQKGCKAMAKKRVIGEQPQQQQQPPTFEEARRQVVEVGSRKRKARKESITRRDLSQMDQPQLLLHPVDEINIDADIVGNDQNLYILASIAETAANQN